MNQVDFLERLVIKLEDAGIPYSSEPKINP